MQRRKSFSRFFEIHLSLITNKKKEEEIVETEKRRTFYIFKQ